MKEQFLRTEMLIGSDAIDKLANAKVAIFGIGGVGSYVAEALARAGVGSFDLIDNDIVNGTYDLSWATELGEKKLPPFNCDVLVEDGDIFQFGNTRIRCVLTAGHTAGVLSFFIELSNFERSIVAAMHGGVGLNSMTREFLNKYGLSLECRDTFRQGLRKLADERVDLVLGNHPYQNNTAEKQKAVASGEGSILDHTEWKRFLIATENNLDIMLEKENL
jgi:metallo-beta-lactamase class B